MVDKQKIRDRINELKFQRSSATDYERRLAILLPLLYMTFGILLASENKNIFGLVIVGFAIIVSTLFVGYYSPRKKYDNSIQENYDILLRKKK